MTVMKATLIFFNFNKSKNNSIYLYGIIKTHRYKKCMFSFEVYFFWVGIGGGPSGIIGL
ncbi:MAG: hypothetical protein ACJA1B_001350 [Polaribacter sp.]|jgi:hypothetical protein